MKNSTILKTITERSSGQGLLLSTLPTNSFLLCRICKQRYDADHYPMIACKNLHIYCKKCLENQLASGSQSNLNKTVVKGCSQCQQKFTKQSIKPFNTYLQICEYIKKLQQISKKQQTRFEIKLIQSEQITKHLKKQNTELKKWIKQVSQKLRQIQIGKKWNLSNNKNSNFKFQLPPQNPAATQQDKDKVFKNSTYEINQGIIKKTSIGSFTNIVGLQPIPKTGVHFFSVKLISSLSGGSIVYGLCTSQAKQQRYAWLSQYFMGYSGNDGDVITGGSWSNMTTLFYQGKKVRGDDTITTIVDMDNKMINWRINKQFTSESYVIPQQMRNKLIYPIVIIQDGDQIQILQNSS